MTIYNAVRNLSVGLKQISKVLNEKITPLLYQQQTQLNAQREDLTAALELQEMMLFVMIRAHADGVFEAMKNADEVQEGYRRILELQEEYLACYAIGVFLSHLGQAD